MRKTKNILVIALTMLLFCGALFVPRPMVARADELSSVAVIDFDNTNIYDDLNAMTINDKPFSFVDYPFKDSGRLVFFNFIEWCYSADTQLQENYGIYLYVYNPSGVSVNTSAFSNKVQLADSYDVDGKPAAYSTFDLKFCSKTTGEYNNLFYKFRINDVSSILERVHNTNPDRRRYDVSSLTLMFSNGSPATRKIGYSYTYTGFAKGFGVEEYSTLDYTYTTIDTLEFTLQHTNYRPKGLSENFKYQESLTSVYFSVPNDYFTNYGYIKRFEAEWYEYVTKPVLVMNDEYIANYLKNYIGVDWRNLIHAPDYGFVFKNFDAKTFVLDYAFWNFMQVPPSGLWIPHPNLDINQFYYMFYNNSSLDDLYVPGSDVIDWIMGYNKTAAAGYLPIKDGTVSADLFEDFVDEGRTRGFNRKVYDMDERDDWVSLTSKSVVIKNGWEGFKGAITGGNYPVVYDQYPDLSPITVVDDTILNGSEEAAAKAYCIGLSDIKAFRQYYKDKKAANESVVLLRIANTQYKATSLYASAGLGGSMVPLNEVGLAARETVFLDFNVLWLDFVKEDGTSTVIPVVASPIDMTGGLAPTPDIVERDDSDLFGFLNDIKSFLSRIGDFISKWGMLIILGIVALLFSPIILQLLFLVVPLFLKALWWLVKQIGKLLLLLVKYIFYYPPRAIVNLITKRKEGGG